MVIRVKNIVRENPDTESEFQFVLHHLYHRESPEDFITHWADLIRKQCD